jgi:hypothetical protein
MSNVEQLESQAKRLTAEKLEAFRDWLDSLASRALEDYKAGRSTTL